MESQNKKWKCAQKDEKRIFVFCFLFCFCLRFAGIKFNKMSATILYSEKATSKIPNKCMCMCLVSFEIPYSDRLNFVSFRANDLLRCMLCFKCY